jgi:dipeptidyl aminopeptidase/acylaminoacyl peptidase
LWYHTAVRLPINLDDGDDIYNWPWLYAVQVGQWRLTDPQAARLRDYLADRKQVPGEWSLRSGVPYRNGGVDPHWRSVYDDKGRLLVAICLNSDIGDSWESGALLCPRNPSWHRLYRLLNDSLTAAHVSLWPMLRLVILLLLPGSALGLTPAQAIKIRNISGVTFSPDGTRLACVVSEAPNGTTLQSHIWLYEVARNEFRQFTFSGKSETSPRWSPDGRTLAFLSSREERMQIFLIRVDGGEASALTSGKNGVNSFSWSPDGSRIAYLAPEPKSEADEKKATDKDDANVADQEKQLPRIWTIDVATKKVKQATSGAWRIGQFDWISANRLIAVATSKPKDETWNNALYEISLDEGALKLFSQPNQPFGGLTVSPDKNWIGFTAANHAGPTSHDLFFQPASGGAARNVTASIDRQVHGVKWQNDGTAIVSVGDGFRSRLYRVAVEGNPVPIELPHSNGDYDISRDGTIVFAGLGFTRLPELFLKSASGPVTQISHLQEGWEGATLANAEVFRFKSFDGKEVEAALMKPKPVGAVPAPKLPLILYVHGGPAGSFSSSYSSWAQLLASHGYQVLMVNPRGSSGYGEEFLKANRADWGGGDFKDCIAALDAVLARGETDSNRLGIGGWSYGGYMAEWAITQTNRFKAAVSGAGMFDLAAEFGTEAGPAGDEWYFGTPWENPDRFAHSSPYMYIKNARTPTLILQGENDATDPLGQSTALYRALKRYGVESELVTYPREPHGPREEKHQLDIHTRILGWFDRYLKTGI